MVNTFAKNYIKLIITVQDCLCNIREKWKKEIYKYIRGILINCEHIILATKKTKNTIHAFFDTEPVQSISYFFTKHYLIKRILKMDIKNILIINFYESKVFEPCMQ